MGYSRHGDSSDEEPASDKKMASLISQNKEIMEDQKQLNLYLKISNQIFKNRLNTRKSSDEISDCNIDP